jgi:hydroxymethylbilane synthase
LTPGTLRVGTRGSKLALTQTNVAVGALRAAASAEGIDFDTEIVTISTKGDRAADAPFEAIGPKGVFAAELQRALLDGAVDVAVHSLKDLPANEPDGLAFAAIVERADARDVVVTRDGRRFADLRAPATVGTSSARRRALIAIHRPELQVVALRGNVDTRLRKVKDGEMDAAVLAGAGLQRLGLEGEIGEWLDPVKYVPAPGQGALLVEARADRLDGDLWWTRGADHAPSRAAAEAERAFMRVVEGGCEAPLGAWARFEGDELVCDGFVSTPDGSRYMVDRVLGREPAKVGAELGERMLRAGARGFTGRTQ